MCFYLMIKRIPCPSFRYNKLAVDGEEFVEEINRFTPLQSSPIQEMPILNVAMGTSHSAVVTGKNTFLFHFVCS